MKGLPLFLLKRKGATYFDEMSDLVVAAPDEAAARKAAADCSQDEGNKVWLYKKYSTAEPISSSSKWATVTVVITNIREG